MAVNVLGHLHTVKDFFDTMFGMSRWAFTGSIAMCIHMMAAGIKVPYDRIPHDIDVLVVNQDDLTYAYAFLKREDGLHCSLKGAPPPGPRGRMVRGFGCKFAVILSADSDDKIDIDIMAPDKGFGSVLDDAENVFVDDVKYTVININKLIDLKNDILFEGKNTKATRDIQLMKLVMAKLGNVHPIKQPTPKPKPKPKPTVTRRRVRTLAPVRELEFDEPLRALNFDAMAFDDMPSDAPTTGNHLLPPAIPTTLPPSLPWSSPVSPPRPRRHAGSGLPMFDAFSTPELLYP